MDVKDLRINDIVKVKTLDYDSTAFRVESIDKYECVGVKINQFKSMECDISDLTGLKVDDALLQSLGGHYDAQKNETMFVFSGGLRIAVRVKLGGNTYVAAKLGEYRPQYCNFKEIHELQHWLWDMFRVEI